MRFSVFPFFLLITLSVPAFAQAPAQSSSSSAKHIKKADADTGLDAGSVIGSVYHNKTLALTCKIPSGWVLRTEEMNARQEDSDDKSRAALDRTAPSATPRAGLGGCPHTCSQVLLAAFSRPPDARGDEVNSSILIAAESAASYPGLKEAVQYFGPLTEIAKAQGFSVDEDPYGYAVGGKTLVRGDFHKNVGSRVMRQSTLALLTHGYAVSITLISGSEDDVEELIDGLGFTGK
jgi:hypothetical protein